MWNNKRVIITDVGESIIAKSKIILHNVEDIE
jgi:hypothetical protein